MWNSIPLIYYILAGLLNFVTSLALAIFVFSRNQKSNLNRAFSLFAFTVAGWSLCYFLWLSTDNSRLAEFYLRTLMFFVVFIPTTFTHFILIFLRQSNKRIIFSNYIISSLLGITVYTKFFASDIGPFLIFPYWLKPRILFGFHTVHFFANVIYAHYLMMEALKTQSGNFRNQVLYVFAGTTIGYVSGAINYLSWYKAPIPPFLNPLVSVYVGTVTYAIIRHQLLDIEVVIKRTLVFAGLAGSVMAVVSVVGFLTQDVLSHYVQVPLFWSRVASAAIIVAIFTRLQRWLVNVTEKYLFQKKYDYKVLLKQFADDVVTILDFKQLLPKTVTALTETVKLDTCSLLLLNKDTRTYELAASKGTNGQTLSIPEEEQFITFLRETHEPINVTGPVKFPEAITERLTQLKARLCLPLAVHDDLIGVLCLGKKKSDEEFTKDDLDILQPLARTVAIAIANAQLFDELAKTQAEAAQKEKLAVIGTLSAGINHEICNPLGIVKSQSEAFLLDLEDGLLKGKSQEEIMERVATILRGSLKQIDRATAITQKLSSFAKPIKQPTTEPVSVEHEVDEVLTLVGHDLKLERIEVTKEFPADVPPIIVDRRQLQEVLFNLIRNAAQVIKPPGRISVRARQQDGQVRIEIEDTGSGIPPDKLGKIYDPFFTTKEPGKGTGLGLFIVRQIIERNRGRISVESTVGKGTTFFLDFPSAKPSAVLA